MFDFLKKKDKGIEIGAPVKGKAVPISQVSDPTFGEEILGKGVAIQPEDGKIYAPADGTIEMLFDTKHAVSMTTTEGVELLVHIGLDTVALKGEHFTAHKGNGDAVKKGEPGVLKMDPAIIRAACDQAHALGLKVAAHVESPEGVKAALGNGVDTIEHGAKPDAEMLELFRTHGASLVTTISPTLSFALFDQSVSHATDMQKYNGRIVMDGIVGCAKACLEAGIPVGLGTDTACPYVTQYGTWRELTYLRRFCGISNTQALHIATLASARIAGVEKETGSIEAGKSADMLVCRENPLNNLAALRQLSSVIFRGKCYTPKVKPISQVEQELDNYL